MKKTFVDSSESLPFQKYHISFEHINIYTKLLLYSESLTANISDINFTTANFATKNIRQGPPKKVIQSLIRHNKHTFSEQ